MNLSEREIEILKLITLEFNDREIGIKLGLSHHTIRSHRKNMMNKLQVRNVAGLVRRGFELKYLTLESCVDQTKRDTTNQANKLAGCKSKF